MKFIPEDKEDYFCSTCDMPDRLREYRIPFAAIDYSKGSFGEILSQSITCKDIAIWQHHFFIRKRVLLHPAVDKGLHTLNYMLHGNISCAFPGGGKLLLQEGTYNLYYIPPVQHDVWLEPGEYRCVHVNLDPAYIEALAMEFHSLDEHLKHSLKSSSEGFHLSPHDLDYNTRLLLKDITRCGETGLARSLFLQARVQDLLLIYIRDMIREKNDLFRIDAKILEAIKTHMLENLHQPLTIASLSRKFGINQTSLRKYFKDYFQETIHHFLIAERMKKALLYLSENTSIHMTAMLVGYGELSSFTRAFKTYFGASPSSYKKSQLPHMRVPDIALAET